MNPVRVIRSSAQKLAQAFRRRRWLRIATWIFSGAVALALVGLILVKVWLIPRAAEKMKIQLASAGIHLEKL